MRDSLAILSLAFFGACSGEDSPTSSPNTIASDVQADFERLQALGYTDGSEPATAASGVLFHDEERAQPGLNFVVSGHFAGATLMDMEGRELHRWECRFFDIWPDHHAKPSEPPTRFWRRAHLFENGDVLGVFEGNGLVKLDAHSEVVWERANQAHHDLHVQPSGEIYVLTRKARILPRVHPRRPVVEDFITRLSAEGTELERVSVLECLEHSEFRHIWDDKNRKVGDIFHTNTLEVLSGSTAVRHPAFSQGRILTSMRDLDAIAVIDPAERKVIWAHTGVFRQQHDPTLLPNGNLLLFDNLGNGGRSQVLEFDPEDMSVVWSYRGTQERPFLSKLCGAAQRLENGNTLISETSPGRAFEITPEGEVVWDYANPGRVGANGELVAKLLEVIRLREDFPTHWAQSRPR